MTKPVTPTLAICLAGTAVMVGALFAEPDQPEATGYDATSSSPSAEPTPPTDEPTDHETHGDKKDGKDQKSEQPSDEPTDATTDPTESTSPTVEPEETPSQKPDNYDEDQDQDDEKGAKPPPPDATMTVDDMTIPSITVSPGDVVKVLNNDDVPHTVTADDGSFYTDVIKPGRSALFTAPTDPGSYGVFCKPHPTMTATVTVQ